MASTARPPPKWLYETTGDGGRQRAQAVVALQDVGATGDHFTACPAREAQWRLISEQRVWSFTAGKLVIIDEASLADTNLTYVALDVPDPD